MAEAEVLQGSSTESFAKAALDAIGPQQDNTERFEVESMTIERGGFVGGTTFRVELRRLGADDSF